MQVSVLPRIVLPTGNPEIQADFDLWSQDLTVTGMGRLEGRASLLIASAQE